jgi:hypothetical protein
MIRPLIYLYVLACLLVNYTASAQNRIAVKPNYSFKDGIYPNLAAFQADKPQYSMFNVEFSAVVNEEKKVVQVEWIRHKRGDTLSLDSIWGICWRGRPYIRIPADSVKRKLAIFAELQVLGNICLFNYETEVEKLVEIKAYFPETGIPFRKGKVRNTETLIKEKMLRLENGEWATFNQQNLAQWVADYPDLQKAVKALAPDRTAELLPRMVLTYNERNPFYLK